MNKTKCSAIQRQLDESLGDDFSAEVAAHLEACAVCSDFYIKQTRLRQLVGSLGTVSAPADFDFRLRARLANETNGSGFHFWSLAYSNLGVILGVLLLGAAFFAVFQFTRSAKPRDVDLVSKENIPREVISPTTPQPTETSENKSGVKDDSLLNTPVVATATDSRSVGEKRGAQFSRRNKRALAVADLSSAVAPNVRDAKSAANYEAVFPVQATQQSLRLSLYDTRGNAKTISLPTVSFGSQRVVPTTTSFAQKGVW